MPPFKQTMKNQKNKGSRQSFIGLSRSTEDVSGQKDSLEDLKLPQIRNYRSALHVPKRKLAVAAPVNSTTGVSSKNTGAKKEETGLPIFHNVEKNNNQSRTIKATLTPTRNPDLSLRRHSDNVRVRYSQQQDFPEVTQHLDSGRTKKGDAFKKTRSISLEDISSTSDKKEFDSEPQKDGSWSRHWLFTRKSVSGFPNSAEMSESDNLVSFHGYDPLGNSPIRSTVLPRISLEERLAHVERQQGIISEINYSS